MFLTKICKIFDLKIGIQYLLNIIYKFTGMGTLGGHKGRLYEAWEVYGDLRGVIRGRLYEVWEVYGDLRGHRRLFIFSLDHPCFMSKI